MPADRSVVVQRLPRVVVVTVQGPIDERFDRASLEALAGTNVPVVIDLAGAPRITSSGIREWLLGFDAMAARELYFCRVRPALVAQFNTVSRFDAGGTV